MFIFYYAVLSEVSPPTALSPFAAAALTGGNPFATMMLTWKYTLPAFLVPFMFTLTPEGLGILMDGTPRDIARVTLNASAGIAALAVALGGWIRHRASRVERGLAGVAGALLCYAAGPADLAGLALMAVVLFLHFGRCLVKAGFEGLGQVAWNQGLRRELSGGRQQGANLRHLQSGKCAEKCQSISVPFAEQTR